MSSHSVLKINCVLVLQRHGGSGASQTPGEKGPDPGQIQPALEHCGSLPPGKQHQQTHRPDTTGMCGRLPLLSPSVDFIKTAPRITLTPLTMWPLETLEKQEKQRH